MHNLISNVNREGLSHCRVTLAVTMAAAHSQDRVF